LFPVFLLYPLIFSLKMPISPGANRGSAAAAAAFQRQVPARSVSRCVCPHTSHSTLHSTLSLCRIQIGRIRLRHSPDPPH
jgi:hypothetical protein